MRYTYLACYLWFYGIYLTILTTVLLIHFYFHLSPIPYPAALPILLFIGLLDAATTDQSLKLGAKESNPLAVFLFERVGRFQTHYLILLVLIPFSIVVWKYTGIVAHYTLISLYTLVPINNLVTIWRRRRANGRA